MKRRAILVWCDSNPTGGLKGPKVDAENMFNFLTSPLGGAWEPHEIRCMENPTGKQVEDTVMQFSETAEATLVYYSGQGGANRRGRGRSLLLADGGHPYRILRCGANLQTIIVDSDRTCQHDFDQKVLNPGVWNDLHGLPKGKFRNLFDTGTYYSGSGHTLITGSNHKGEAVDTLQGGAFTLALLKAAEQFAKGRTNYNMLDLGWALSRAKAWMKREGITLQCPTVRKEGKGRLPMIAVKPWGICRDGKKWGEGNWELGESA